MNDTYFTECACGKEVTVSRHTMPEMAADWDEAVSEAGSEAAIETQAEFDDWFDPDAFGGDVLTELAAALRRHDIAEAELLLDQISNELGPRAQEAVANGRYSMRAVA